MAIRRTEGAFRTDGAEEGGKAIRETLAPAETYWRDGVRDGVFGDRRDDFAVRNCLSHPAFAIGDVTEEPPMALWSVSERVEVISGTDTLTSSRVIRFDMSFSSNRSNSLIISAPSEHGLSSGQS